MKKFIYAVMLLLCLSIIGCQKDEPKPELVKVTAVTLNTTSATLVEGETLEIVATISPSNAEDKTIHWSTSNSDVTTVNNGTITAVKPGIATINATSNDGGKTATCQIEVISKIIAVESVILDKTNIELSEGDEQILTATVKPDNASNKNVKWTSSDEKVATVNDGKVTAVKRGCTTITATSEDGGKTVSCSITVLAKEIPEGAVDLGLSVFWASCNLGAINPEEYGEYYAWGEIETKTDFSNETYKYGHSEVIEGYVDDDGFEHGEYVHITYSKYVTKEFASEYGYNGYYDDIMVLQLCDDAANNKLGKNWRMPTREEARELLSKCEIERAILRGVHGTKITSKVDGFTNNWIFLPDAGMHYPERIYDLGSAGAYWTSSLSGYSGEFLRLFSNGLGVGTGLSRSTGLPIRPVSD